MSRAFVEKLEILGRGAALNKRGIELNLPSIHFSYLWLLLCRLCHRARNKEIRQYKQRHWLSALPAVRVFISDFAIGREIKKFGSTNSDIGCRHCRRVTGLELHHIAKTGI